jgi:hypothetical protein
VRLSGSRQKGDAVFRARWGLVLLILPLIGATATDAGARSLVRTDPLPTAVWTAESNQPSAYFGLEAASAGDVNGDGYRDVIVGAPHFDHGQLDEGRAFVYHGSASGLSSTPDWTAESDQARAWFGRAVGTAGDVNGDGYDDVIVGASFVADGEQRDQGRAFVYLGSPGGLSSTPDWTADAGQRGSWFGSSVGTAGDVNGDGFADVIVGAYNFDHGQTDEGRAFVYFGSPNGLSSTPNWTAESNQADALFGQAVGTAGDVNGDGYADVIVGSFYFHNGQEQEGRAFVYEGSPTGPSASPDWTAEPDQVRAWFGWSVGTAGDVNGDGYSDVVVGARYFDNGQDQEGRAFVYEGSPGGLSAVPDWTAESNKAKAWFGWSVGTAGDVNGDGYSDVVVGAAGFTNGQDEEGRAFLFHGSAGGLDSVSSWTAEGNQEDAYFGWWVRSAGDVNGDGYAETIVGDPYFDHGQADEGRAFVYSGGPSA